MCASLCSQAIIWGASALLPPPPIDVIIHNVTIMLYSFVGATEIHCIEISVTSLPDLIFTIPSPPCNKQGKVKYRFDQPERTRSGFFPFFFFLFFFLSRAARLVWSPIDDYDWCGILYVTHPQLYMNRERACFMFCITRLCVSWCMPLLLVIWPVDRRLLLVRDFGNIHP